MRIVIFGGTTEGRKLSEALAAEGAEVTVSVASDYGLEEQQKSESAEHPGAPDLSSGSITVSAGAKDEDEICRLIKDADLCIDATHPYAVVVTENVRRAAEKEQVDLLRLTREHSEIEEGSSGSGVFIASSPEEAADMVKVVCGDAGKAVDKELSFDTGADVDKELCGGVHADVRTGIHTGANVLLTTGSKDIEVYAERLEPGRLFPRVLPLIKSLEACEKAGIPHRNIIAAQGPFSEEMNIAVLKDYSVDVMITKESGRAGGFAEKISACRKCKVPVIVIRRPEDDGMSYSEVLESCICRMRARKTK